MTTLVTRIIEILENSKAVNIVHLHVGNKTTITDDMFICSGLSSRHVQSIAQILITTLKTEGIAALHVSGLETGEWALVDFGDAVVHVMQQETREFYNLEGLWQNCCD